MTQKAKLFSSLSKNDTVLISDLINKSEMSSVARDIDYLISNDSEKIQKNPQFKEAIIFAIELMLMIHVKKRNAKGSKIPPLFKKNFYSKLNTVL